MTTRRAFLTILGSTAVIAAAGATGFALTREPVTALAPWRSAGGAAYGDPRLRALSYALLAPNPHNRQPWAVDLSEPGAVTLYCDLKRLLPETDPPNRQITIGLGAFLELARLAAAADGYDLAIQPFPDGEPGETLDARPIARMTFTPSAAPQADDLFAHVLDRRTSRVPFDTARPVSEETLVALRGAGAHGTEVAGTIDMSLIQDLRRITLNGWQVETATHRTHMESVLLTRIGRQEIEANPDGISLGGPALEAAALLGLLTREKLADPATFAYRSGLEMYTGLINSAMGFIWIRTALNTRLDQLAAGRDWLRLNLKATALGLSIHPLSQVLQEFPEMAENYAEVHERLGVTEGRIQMLGRIGYAAAQGPSPRWPLESRIRAT